MTDSTTPRRRTRWALAAALSIVLIGLAWSAKPVLSQPDSSAVMPVFDDEGRLQLPADFGRWVFAGSSVGLSYSEGGAGREMFHETLIEPTAFEHFQRTGTFRQGTMLALQLHEVGESVLPQRQGRFAGPVAMIEIALKSDRFEGGWGYFGFNPEGGHGGARSNTWAKAFGRESCSSCHQQHARYDNVFLQFYPQLAKSAPAGSPAATAVLAASRAEGMPAASPAPASAQPASSAALALTGLDPVMLVEGRDDGGKPEIVMIHEGFEYRFVSEPSRKRFEADPARYTFQNETCIMVPGAPINGSLFAVHDQRIYGFASQGCVDSFLADPEAAVSGASETGDSDDPEAVL